jgi:hypothetical protein
MNGKRHVRLRLSQYGALWLGSFLMTLLAMATMVLGLRFRLGQAADLILPVAFGLLLLAVLAGVVLTALKDVGLSTKSLVTALALLLVLPLLWSPVLAVVVVAAIAGASVEYSETYAAFRAAVSHLIYPLIAMLGGDPLFTLIWQAFQVVASVVGFVASALQVWQGLKTYMFSDDTAEVEEVG